MKCTYTMKDGADCPVPVPFAAESSSLEKRFRLCSWHVEQSGTRFLADLGAAALVERRFAMWARPGISDDPGYLQLTYEQGLAALELALQRWIVSSGAVITREYLQRDRLQGLRQEFCVALMKRADLVFVPPFEVTINGLRNPDGNFSAGVASYKGAMLVHSTSRRMQNQIAQVETGVQTPPKEVPPKIGDVLRRPGEWEF